MTLEELPDEEDAPRRPRMSGREAAIWGARTTGGAVAVVVAAVVAGGSLFVSLPSWSVAAPVVDVTPQPAQELLVCPGPILRLADDTGQNASDATPIDSPALTFYSDSGTVTTRPLGASDVAGSGGTDRAPRIAVVDPVEGAAPLVGGVQTDTIVHSVATIQGLATASCTQPSLRSWIVAGSTELGRTSLLTLVNPTSVAATVDLSLYGALGPLDAPGTKGIVVPPDSQRVIPVNGLALEQAAPVIGITSSGGNVVAYLQESIVRTLTPGGMDLSGSQAPSEQLVIPGVRVAGEKALQPLNETPADLADTQPTLRLFAPGAATTTATVALIPKGKTLADALAAPDAPAADTPTDSDSSTATPAEPTPRSFQVRITEGAVAEVPIAGVAPGEYTVVVTADVPLVGALRASSTGSSGTDFAWFQPADALGARAVAVAPAVPSPVLYVANPLDAEAQVTVTAGPNVLQLTIPAGGTGSLSLNANAQYVIEGRPGLRAAFTTGASGFIAQSIVQPPAPLATPVRVHV